MVVKMLIDGIANFPTACTPTAGDLIQSVVPLLKISRFAFPQGMPELLIRLSNCRLWFTDYAFWYESNTLLNKGSIEA